MNYQLIQKAIILVEEFDTQENKAAYTQDIQGFRHWISDGEAKNGFDKSEPIWEGKENGRSPESAINTLLVHMNRYAKTYSKSAIYGSEFSTQEDFIYLITLKTFGSMTKMELINKNLHDKPTGMQIINRLIKNGWVAQTDSQSDKRTKFISLEDKGLQTLEQQMDRIRQASQIVTGKLEYSEKMELIRLLSKLNDFHHPIFSQHLPASQLLEKVGKQTTMQ